MTTLSPAPTRRTALLVSAIAAATVLSDPSHADAVTRQQPVLAGRAPAPGAGAVRLPDPTGPYPVGTIPLHLVDTARTDPWVSGNRPREVMVQLWYPARPAVGPTAPWLTPATAEQVRNTLGVPGGASIATHARLGAPVAPGAGRRPVVLYSHGFATTRALGTALVEDLASRGYVVAAIDHTHDATGVEFPGGRLERGAIQVPAEPAEARAVLSQAVTVRTADARFVLDQLALLDRGGNPDAEHRALPHGLRASLRLSGVGVLGHSLGGATAAALMQADRRITAGVNLDGYLVGGVPTNGLPRPFLQIGSATHSSRNDPGWAELARRSQSWFRELNLTGSAHFSFTDLQTILPPLATGLGLPPQQVAALIGNGRPDRSVLIQRTYVASFLDLHLQHRDCHLFDGPSPRFPEITMIQPPAAAGNTPRTSSRRG